MVNSSSFAPLVVLLFLGGIFVPAPRKIGLNSHPVRDAAAWGVLALGWVVFVRMSINSFGPLGGSALTGLLMYASAHVARMAR